MKRKKMAVAALSGIFAAALCFSGCSLLNNWLERNGNGNSSVEEPVVSAGYTEQVVPPEDESKPTDYSGLENVSFMAYRLANTRAYASEAMSRVETKIGFITYKQNVETYKDYYEGVMLVEDISKSSLVNSALQSCFIGDRVLWRGPSSNKAAAWNGRQTEWATSDPVNRSVEEYMTVYGLPSTEFSVYVLNASTLTKWSCVTDNGDGTYSQTVYPDVSAAGRYYAIRMRTMGNLSSYPTFNSIQITYTFDSEWRVLSSVTEENYCVDMGLLHSDNCNAITEQTYSYNEAEVDISDYTNFFSRYEQLKTSSEEPGKEDPPDVTEEPTAMDYLFSAFAGVLTEPQMLDLVAEIDGKEITGGAYLDLMNEDFRMQTEDVCIWYTDGNVYLRAAENLVSVSFDGLKEYLSASGGGEANIDFGQLLGQLGESEITETEDGAVMETELSFGDTELTLDIYFYRSESGEISFNYLQIQPTVLFDSTVSATISFGEGEPIAALTAAEKSNAADVTPVLHYIDDLQALFTGKQLDVEGIVSADVNGVEVSLDFKGNVDWTNGTEASLAVQANVAGTLHDLIFVYREDEIFVVYGKIGVRVAVSEFDSLSAAVTEAYNRISELLNVTEEENAALGGITGVTADALLEILNEIRLDVTESDGLNVLVGIADNEFNFTFDGATLGLKAAPLVVDGTELSVQAAVTAGKNAVALPADIEYVTEAQLEILCGYVTDICDIISAEEWNIGYTMSVFSEEAAYAAYDYVRYNVEGNIQIVPYAEGDVQLSLSLYIAATTEEKSYFIRLTVREEKLYLLVSYYMDETNENYNPLLMSGNISDLSALLDTVQTVAGYDMPFLDEILDNFVSISSQVQTNTSEWKISDLFEALRVTEENAELELNGGLLFGEGADNMTLTLSRGGEGEKLSVLASNIVYACEPKGWLNMTFVLKEEACSVAVPEGDYIDISSLDRLVNSLLNSFFTVEDNVLNPYEGYYFGGKVTCTVGSYDLNFDIGVNMTVSDGLILNISIGADSTLAVNSGKYLSYLTMDLLSGMVYMTRYQYEYYKLLSFHSYAQPVVTYRAMTMEEFGEDYWNQIVYLTNMGDTVASLISNQINGGSSGGDGILKDVGSYLCGYNYNAEENSYTLVLNGSNFAEVLGDINLKLLCDEEGRIVNIFGSVEMYVTLSVDIDYENITKPDGGYTLTLRNVKDEWQKENYDMTVSAGHTESCDSVLGVAEFTSEVTLHNGGEISSVQVIYGAPMSALAELADTQTSRFMGWFTQENGQGERVTDATVDSGFGGGDLYAYWIDFVILYLDGGEGTLSSAEIKAIPSELWQNLQSVKAENGNDRLIGWQDGEGTAVTAENIASYQSGEKIYAVYKEAVSVSLRSDVAFTVDGESVTEYEFFWKEDSVLPAVKAEGYLFVGWFMQEGESWVLADESAFAEADGAVTLWAVWIQNDLTVSVTGASRNKTLFVYTWKIEGAYTGGGFAEGMSETIASSVGYGESAEVWYRLSDDGETAKDTLNSGNSVGVSGGAFSKSGMTSTNDGVYAGATVKITYTIGGVTVTLEQTDWLAR